MGTLPFPDHGQQGCDAHGCIKMADTELQPEQPAADTSATITMPEITASAAACGLNRTIR